MTNFRASDRNAIGKRAENAVCDYLCSKGFTCIARNYRAGNSGELDLVFLYNGCLYVTEVKSRNGKSLYGGPAEAITPMKLVRIRRATAIFLSANRYPSTDVRFLAGCVTHDDNGNIIHIEILPI